jgi:hypothetical protein
MQGAAAASMSLREVDNIAAIWSASLQKCCVGSPLETNFVSKRVQAGLHLCFGGGWRGDTLASSLTTLKLDEA